MRLAPKVLIGFIGIVALTMDAHAAPPNATAGTAKSESQQTIAEKQKLAKAMAAIAVDSAVRTCLFERTADERVAKCTKAIQMLRSPSGSSMRNLLPSILAARGQGYAMGPKPDFKKAIRDYDSAIRLAPSADDYYYRGIAYLHENNADHALRDFKVFVSREKSTTSALGYVYIGYIYGYEKSYAKAATAYRKAIHINPKLKDNLAKSLAYDEAHAGKAKKSR